MDSIKAEQVGIGLAIGGEEESVGVDEVHARIASRDGGDLPVAPGKLGPKQRLRFCGFHRQVPDVRHGQCCVDGVHELLELGRYGFRASAVSDVVVAGVEHNCARSVGKHDAGQRVIDVQQVSAAETAAYDGQRRHVLGQRRP